MFIGPPDRDAITYNGFVYGKVYQESPDGTILGHIGPNSKYTEAYYTAIWKAVDFEMYLKEIETDGSI